MKDLKLLLSMLSDLKGQRRWIGLALFLYVPVTLLALAQPLLIAKAAQVALLGESLSDVMQYAWLFLIVVVTHGVFEMSQLFLMQLMGQRFVRVVRQRLFEKAQYLPLS